MLQCIIAAILLVASVMAPATAAGLQCRNEAAETSCTAAGKCETRTTGFTPMELNLDGDTISICAYSGCSSGKVLMRRQRGDLVFIMADVYPNALLPLQPIGSRQKLSALFDRKTGAVTMYWLNFVNAMTCAAVR